MNQLEEGMLFKSSIAVAKFLGYKDVLHSNQNLSRLSHYCDYERDDNNNIIIKKVFETPLPFKNRDFVYNIGEIVNTKNSSIKIINRFRDYDSPNHKCKFYTCKCLKDDYIFDIRESRITSMDVGCPLCGGHKLVNGYTSLYDEHPELLKYLINKDTAKNITSGSNRKILCQCPLCNSKKEMFVNNLVKHGFSCSVCNDGISYPNKFIRKMLIQLNIDFISEKSFEWSNGKIYDIFIPSKNLIIENHGKQHYEDVDYFRTTSNEQKEIDDLKYSNAIENGIQYYIQLDCSNSNKEYIKNSILHSILPSILGFAENNIDWNECDLYASKSIITEICTEWQVNKNITDLSKKFGLALGTIRKYLKTGAENGLCDYQNHIFTYDNQKRGKDKFSKPIYCETSNIYFYSSRYCEEYFKNDDPKFNGKYLYNYINNNSFYHGKKFIYISKKLYNNMKKKSLIDSSIKVVGDLYEEKYVMEE